MLEQVHFVIKKHTFEWLDESSEGMILNWSVSMEVGGTKQRV